MPLHFRGIPIIIKRPPGQAPPPITSQIKTVNGLVQASVKTMNGVPMASVKSVLGVLNQ